MGRIDDLPWVAKQGVQRLVEERLGARTFAGCLGREKIYGLATLLAPGSKEKNPPLEG